MSKGNNAARNGALLYRSQEVRPTEPGVGCLIAGCAEHLQNVSRFKNMFAGSKAVRWCVYRSHRSICTEK
jgi:hypothetical protein